ncbi:MAG: Ldh family oxidoreductase [Lunatimonas sp.]|uniref:Ldh family oxidoreductase n=1 Tax=Lunatimonas sp. TaxID=2060141 RepID=UPI00263AB90E|nr:Ldh family oxidoreductase [Lunatimonas sp.]MCC5936087.1 Ldh family oxidoreductase [Lunatimonas sp.]
MEYAPIDHLDLRRFVREVFEWTGIPAADAALASEVLAYSDEHGIDSHGVARLDTYFDLIQQGKINKNPTIRILREKASVATIDGDNGLGLVVGPKCNEIAMEKASEYGSGWVSVCHTNHYGAAGYYPVQALRRDLIGLSMTNTTKGVVPFNGREKMLGTNPVAVAFPAATQKPLIIDMASSTVAYGKVEIADRQGKSVPYGWCIDAQGQATVNPLEMIQGGSLLPLGSDEAGSGHKGYCLATMVDVLSAVLSGANWGPFAVPFAIKSGTSDTKQVGKGIGHFFGAWDISGFQDLEFFKRSVDEWIRVMRSTPPLPGATEVLVPGDPEHRAYGIRIREGIPLDRKVLDSLRRISTVSGIGMPVYH